MMINNISLVKLIGIFLSLDIMNKCEYGGQEKLTLYESPAWFFCK